jgi:transcriptional regulator with GAF, ATPase, and Fis domain
MYDDSYGDHLSSALKSDELLKLAKLLGFKYTSRLVEAFMIHIALEESKGKKCVAARKLRLRPTTLSSRMKALQLYLDQFGE